MTLFRRKNLIFILFCVWYIAVVFSYSIHAFVAITKNIFIFWDYSNVEIPGFLGFIKNIKDIVMVLLFILLVCKRKINRSYYIIIPFLLYIIPVTIINSAQDFKIMMIAGIREFLPLLVCLMIFQEDKHTRNSSFDIKKTTKIIILSIVIEALILFVQITKLHTWSSARTRAVEAKPMSFWV